MSLKTWKAIAVVLSVVQLTLLWRLARIEGSGPEATEPKCEHSNFGNLTDDELPIMLAWSKLFGRPLQKRGVITCGGKHRCLLTDNQRYLPESAVVLFDPNHMQLSDRLLTKKHGQKFLFYSHEAPPQILSPSFGLDDFFDWSMTYRRDSTFYCPYGQLVARPNGTDLSHLLRQRLPRRPHLLAWIVSKCNTHSGRERYVKELSKHLPVDIFGQCGPLKMRRSRSWEIRYLGANYKFRIAFENSVCEDYQTERFFDSLLSYTVPIVLRRSDYAHVAPQSSFIAVDDFANVTELAKYLKYLDQHDDEYLRYFEWQRTKTIEFQTICFCDLCRALRHNGDLPSSTQLRRFHEWWQIGNKCIPKFVSAYI